MTGEPLNPGGSLLRADVGPFYAPITTRVLLRDGFALLERRAGNFDGHG